MPIGDAVERSDRPSRDVDADRAFALGIDLLRSGHPGASQVLDRCLALFPDHVSGWRSLGETLLDLGKAEAALVCLERVRGLAPSADLAVRVGTTLQLLGRHAEARATFAEAVSRAPGSVRGHFLEGVAAQDAGDPAGAVSAYRRALALDPGLAEAALNLGTALQAMGDIAAARAAYGQAIRLKPETWGRAAQALTTASSGELWLDLGALRSVLEAG